ncbi:hypothetical protein Tco_1515573 [Tanacetum coccineum]
MLTRSLAFYPCDSAESFSVILVSIHNDEWKSLPVSYINSSLRYGDCAILYESACATEEVCRELAKHGKSNTSCVRDPTLFELVNPVRRRFFEST